MKWVEKIKGSENPIILAEVMKKHGFEDTVIKIFNGLCV